MYSSIKRSRRQMKETPSDDEGISKKKKIKKNLAKVASDDQDVTMADLEDRFVNALSLALVTHTNSITETVKEQAAYLGDKLGSILQKKLSRKILPSKRNETGEETTRALKKQQNSTIIGHFPEDLDVLFIQQAHPAKKYSTYYFQSKSNFWTNMFKYGIINVNANKDNFLDIMKKNNWGFATLIEDRNWGDADPVFIQTRSQMLRKEIREKKPKMVVCLGNHVLSNVLFKSKSDKSSVGNLAGYIDKVIGSSEFIHIPTSSHRFKTSDAKRAWTILSQYLKTKVIVPGPSFSDEDSGEDSGDDSDYGGDVAYEE